MTHLLITDLISIMFETYIEHINPLITLLTLERTVLKVIDFTEWYFDVILTGLIRFIDYIDPIHDLLYIIDPIYLLYTFETKLLTITNTDCINHNKLFMYCSHKSVHVINHINFTVSKNCIVNIKNSIQNVTLRVI